MKPSCLVFAGGGTRCLTFVQTLIDLEVAGNLKHVNEYWGTSAGALLATLLAMTKSAERVKELMFKTDYTQFRNVNLSNILSITTTWGIDDGRSLTAEIERMLEFIEPDSSKKRLIDISGLNIVVSDLHSHETIVCNSKSYPDLAVVDAIRASMSLPILFTPYKHKNGHLWVDGAIKANFPWHLLPNDEARNNALGFAFEKSWHHGPKNFNEYLFSMIHFDEPKKVEQLKTDWAHNILWFPSPPFPSWFVRFKEEDFILITNIGASVAADALSRWKLRQHSDLRTTQNQPYSEHRNIHSQVLRQDHKDELSEIPKYSFPLQHQDSSLPQSLGRTLSSRRWSV
jgi:NTE family protein